MGGLPATCRQWNKKLKLVLCWLDTFSPSGKNGKVGLVGGQVWGDGQIRLSVLTSTSSQTLADQEHLSRLVRRIENGKLSLLSMPGEGCVGMPRVRRTGCWSMLAPYWSQAVQRLWICGWDHHWQGWRASEGGGQGRAHRFSPVFENVVLSILHILTHINLFYERWHLLYGTLKDPRVAISNFDNQS